MWRKIKSLNILKKVFNQLAYNKKLATIVYNKKIQKKFGLNLYDYRRLSGKYKEENNDKIRIYNSYNHKLLFKGNYSNRQKNGNGEEYNDDGELIFIGEYLDGKKWKGTEYIYDEDTGNKILKCELINGEKNGRVKEYDKYNGDLIFEGVYLNGKRNGTGIEYKSILCNQCDSRYYSKYNSNLIKIFEGEYLNDERIFGKEYNYDEKLIYEGGYLNDKRNGNVKIYENDKLKYEGEYLNGKRNGKGIEYNRKTDIIYIGEFLYGKRNGKGKEY